MDGKNRIEYAGRVFEHEDIKSGNLYCTASLLSDSLDPNTLEFDVASQDASLTDFVRSDPVYYYRGDMLQGVFYLQSIERVGEETYHFFATSAIGLLIERQHYGGIYTGETVEEILPAILGTVPYYVKTDLKDTKLYGWLPVASSRDNLSQVLLAIGATVKTDLDGYLRIESLWDGISGEIGRERIYTGASVDYGSKVTQVIVTEHQYIEGSEDISLFEGTAQDGDIITFDEPAHHLSASGFAILESGANYAVISGGTGTLSGKKYIHNTRQVTKEVSKADEPNIKKVTDATLISLVNSEAVAQRLVNYYQHTETINDSVVYRGNRPGDLVSTYHAYDKKGVSACLQSADINLSNVLKSTEKSLVGYVPLRPENVVTYEYIEVLTKTGPWTVPDEVTSIRAVLIGGGWGGGMGQPGETGGRASSNQNGTGGEGGEPGEGGSGGNIYTVTIAVKAGQKLSATIGAGGAASTSAGQPGSPGGNTLFEGYTSASGGPSPTGFDTTIGEEVYALPGGKGIAGGKGAGRDGDGGEVMDEDGKVTHAGAKGNDHSYGRGFAVGGFGGGPAAGVDGNRGMDGHVEYQSANSTYFADGGDGGKGGTPVPRKAATQPGCGGPGGHGGGGGGGGGGATSSDGSQYAWQGGGGAGGDPGKPGAGAPGCVILYYGIPHKIDTGWFKTRDGDLFIDRYIRRFIV